MAHGKLIFNGLNSPAQEETFLFPGKCFNLWVKFYAMRKVSDILKRKGSGVTTVTPDTTVIAALKIMSEQNIGSLVIMENDTFLGIMTERDYSRKVILMGRHSSDTPVKEIMTTDFPAVKQSDTVEACMQLMSDKHIRYLPVIENGKLAGIISINDVVTETISTQQETISHLHSYIQS
jgi:CBS domain-containing protein